MASEVLHGRRKGALRSAQLATQELTLTGGCHGQGSASASKFDVRQVTILSKDEFARISGYASKREQEREEAARRQLEREEMHLRSLEQTGSWKNTVKGKQKARMEAWHAKKQKEEGERQEIDIEEAQYQADKRKQQLDNAKLLQYYETDRVKQFHTALRLTEVLKERDEQVKLKEAREARAKEREIMEEQKRQSMQSTEDDRLKEMERIRQRRELAEDHKEKARRNAAKADSERERELREGEEIRKLVDQYNEEARLLDDIKHKEKEDLRQTYQDMMRQNGAMKEAERRMEEDADDEIRQYAAGKKKLAEMRRKKEREIFSKIQEHRDQMINKLGAQMKQRVDDEDDRIGNAVEERERKHELSEQERQAKMRRAFEEEAAHRAAQAKKRDLEQEFLLSEEQRFNDLTKQADKAFDITLQAKQQARKAREVELANGHLKQAGYRKERAQVEKLEELEKVRKDEELLVKEEDQFQEYAYRVISHLHERGRNVYPMVKATRIGIGGGTGPAQRGGVKPSYIDSRGDQLPTFQTSGTDESKKNIYGEEASSKRLGFVW